MLILNIFIRGTIVKFEHVRIERMISLLGDFVVVVYALRLSAL